MNQHSASIIWILAVLLVIYVICTVVDFLRQGLFAITVDRHPGHWFEILWKKIADWQILQQTRVAEGRESQPDK